MKHACNPFKWAWAAATHIDPYQSTNAAGS